ncbi:hypothetical protein JCM30237_07130 [Halolamina litorea]|jgi:hypothetical protein|uniref:Uncharacterized protein n=1 Tax=Halolamina litorea TaxID=1515593 RepID=A0ABD6BR89_9EURY|nr:hypothetical protein [Halolamina litorea]
MRLKPLPAPPAPDAADEDDESAADRPVFEAIADAQSAVPLVPGSENDCCARLMRREGHPSRDVAREWLTFLRALELAVETETGFKRTDREPTPENVRSSFRERVFGASEALDVLADAAEPIDAAEAFDRLRATVPGWERERRRTWVEHWTDRTERVLDWLVALDLADRVEGGYVAAEN